MSKVFLFLKQLLRTDSEEMKPAWKPLTEAFRPLEFYFWLVAHLYALDTT